MNTEPTILRENGYFRCRSRKHLWSRESDALCCCDPRYSRAMIPVSELQKGQLFLPASVDGFVFVWLLVERI